MENSNFLTLFKRNRFMKCMSKYIVVILILLAGLVEGCKERTSKPVPDPLAGWRSSGTVQSNKSIADDYQDYIKNLSLNQDDFIFSEDFYEDGTGQHAVDIKIGENGQWWYHVLKYD